MSNNLKQELGLGDPQAKGSDEQQKQFRAAFQAEMNEVNGKLQYTAAHAEKAKHDPEAGKRDKACSAYQVALGKIDPANPSAAQAAIDKVLAAAQGLKSSAASLKDKAEKAFEEWTKKEPELDALTDTVREMVEWGFEKGSALQEVIEKIAANAGERKYEAASGAVDQVKQKAKGLFEEFENQKAAKQEYDGGVDDLEGKLGEINSKDPPEELVEEKKAIEAEKEIVLQQAKDKDYVSAVDMLKSVFEKIAALLEKLQEWGECVLACGAARHAYDKCHLIANSHESLKAEQDKLGPMLEAMDAAKEAKDYPKATQLAEKLKTACSAYMKKAAEAQKKYDEEAKNIAKKLDDADPDKREEIARKITSDLDEKELKHLPTDIRNRLLQEMDKDGLSDDDKKAIDNLYSVKYLDPKFEELELQNQKDMLQALENEPAFEEARKKWADPSFSKEEKLKALQKAVDIHAKSYGFSPGTIVGYDREEEKKKGNKAAKYGYYRHSEGKLYVNTEDKVLVGEGFDEAMDTAVHEHVHRYQGMLVDRLDGKVKPEIKKGDPLYDQAMAFKMNKKYYVRSGNPSYATQPMETHARATHQMIEDAEIGK